MYIENFKLRELPFRLSPDPQFLYLSRAHARAKAYMESTIWFTDGFVVVTGEIGSGKTTLIESFLRQLDSDVVIAQINQTQVNAVEFLQSVLVQFGFSPFKMKKAELIATLNSFLIEQYAAGRKVLLIIDEAQNLSLKVLEEIRMLSGIESTKEKVLRIILAGQPELNEKLDSPELVQLTQRIRLRFHLGTLSREDLRSYVRHRLDVAGADGREIFAEDTFPELFRYTGGVPRLVNTLCDTAMMAAFNEDRDFVTPGGHRLGGQRAAVGGILVTRQRHRRQERQRRSRDRVIARPARFPSWCCPPTARPLPNCTSCPAARSSAARRTTICRSTASSSAGITASSSPAAMASRSSKTSTAPTASWCAASACAAIRCATVTSSPSASTKSCTSTSRPRPPRRHARRSAARRRECRQRRCG